MLGNSPYYFETIEKYIAAFGWIFQDITIQRKDPRTSVIKSIEVPIDQASKEKWAQRYISDPNAGNEATQKHVQIVLPRMAYDLVGFHYDSRRKLSPIMYRTALTDTNTTVKKQLNPVPMIFNFELYLQTRTLRDGFAIIEQFLPFFQPDFTIPVTTIPELNLSRDIVVSITGNSHTDSYEGQFLDKRILEWQFDFELRGEIYPPIKEKKVIKSINVGFGDTEELGTYDDITLGISPSTAKQNETFTVTEE